MLWAVANEFFEIEVGIGLQQNFHLLISHFHKEGETIGTVFALADQLCIVGLKIAEYQKFVDAGGIFLRQAQDKLLLYLPHSPLINFSFFALDQPFS